MQFLSGNSGSGGMLFESNSSGSAHVYQDLYGEQVYGSGIVFLAKKSDIGVLGKDVYVRSGVEQKGSITLDSAQGEQDLVCYSRMMNVFNSQGVNIWHSPQGEEGGTFDASHRFAKDCSMISGHVLIDKWIISRKGGLITEKIIAANDHILAIKKMAQKDGGMVGDSKEAKPDIIEAITTADTGMNEHKDIGEPVWKGSLKSRWYQSPMMLGNKELTTQYLGFSFNDRKDGPGFNLNETWGLIESRWQQYVRLDLASGGTEWKEKKVKYQGTDLYPFPGKKLWKEDKKFVQLKKLNMFDTAKSYSKDRPGEYEEPKLEDFEEKTADGNYKIISSS